MVGLLVVFMNPAKTAESIEMPLRGLRRVAQGITCLMGSRSPIHLPMWRVTSGRFGTRVSSAKTAQLIEMLFGDWLMWWPKEPLIWWESRLDENRLLAMWPFVKICWPLIF